MISRIYDLQHHRTGFDQSRLDQIRLDQTGPGTDSLAHQIVVPKMFHCCISFTSGESWKCCDFPESVCGSAVVFHSERRSSGPTRTHFLLTLLQGNSFIFPLESNCCWVFLLQVLHVTHTRTHAHSCWVSAMRNQNRDCWFRLIGALLRFGEPWGQVAPEGNGEQRVCSQNDPLAVKNPETSSGYI